MLDVIAGLKILKGYKNTDIGADHDEIIVWIPNKDDVSAEDQLKLSELNWFWSKDSEGWKRFV
jgi:hypothetical protein